MRKMKFRLRAAEDALEIARDALRKADSAAMTLEQTLAQAYPIGEFERGVK
jgi:hypothetical protein